MEMALFVKTVVVYLGEGWFPAVDFLWALADDVHDDVEWGLKYLTTTNAT